MLRLKELIGGLAVVGVSAAASADVTFNLSFEISGASPPAGPVPWMTLTFSDTDTDEVTLVVSNNLVGTEHVKVLMFNLNTVFDEPDLDVARSYSAGEAPSNLLVPVAAKSDNPLADATFKADGDGYFDFRIDWDNGDFTGSESATFVLTGSGLDEADFDYLSEPGGGNGQHHAAAHVGGIGLNGDDSGWIADNPPPIPLPTAAGLGFVGLLGLGAVRRRTR